MIGSNADVEKFEIIKMLAFSFFKYKRTPFEKCQFSLFHRYAILYQYLLCITRIIQFMNVVPIAHKNNEHANMNPLPRRNTNEWLDTNMYYSAIFLPSRDNLTDKYESTSQEKSK